MKCIDPWLTKNRKVCPVCKGKVILPGMSDDSDSELEAEINEDSANERTPLIASSSNPSASTSTRRIANYAGTLSSNFRLRFDRSTQVNPSSRNSSILTSVEADITPITVAPEHSVNCEIEVEPSGQWLATGNEALARTNGHKIFTKSPIPNGRNQNVDSAESSNTASTIPITANTTNTIATTTTTTTTSVSTNNTRSSNRDIIV